MPVPTDEGEEALRVRPHARLDQIDEGGQLPKEEGAQARLGALERGGEQRQRLVEAQARWQRLA